MNICETNSDFDFNKLTLAQPNGLQGGSYFTRLSVDDNPLYIQAPVCKTKQGLVTSGKKTYCDLMFTNDNEEILDWLEKLEKSLIDKIYEKRNVWFHNSLDKEDIENAFTSILRIYKGGKFYLVRVNLGNDKSLSEKPFTCFDDQENPVEPEKIKDDKIKVIPLLEFLGVKFSSKSFHIEISLRQLMVLNEPEIFNTCLIKPKLTSTSKVNTDTLETLDNSENITETTNFNINIESENKYSLENVLNEQDSVDESVTHDEPISVSENKNKEKCLENDITESNELNDLDNNRINLEEVELSFDNLGEETISLKKPNEVYLELWKEARLAAKESRKNAIKAYLNAKNIKATYMLNEIDDDSYDEFDNYLESCQDTEIESYLE